MKNSFAPATALKSALLVALLVVLFQIFMASRATVLVPLVDGWAVWNRSMLLAFGEIPWLHYLFDPHGAHPHFVVYLIAWFDVQWGHAQQHVMAATTYLAILVFSLFITELVVRRIAREGASATVQIVAAIAVAALLSSLADYETLIQPFQVVMSVSRLTYVLLFWFLVRNLRQQNVLPYLAIVACATFSVTFHGAGYIFAGVFLFVHIVMARRWWMAVGAIFPAVFALLMSKKFGAAGGELSHMDALLSFEKIWIFLKGVFAYLVTPLMQSSLKQSDTVMLSIGALCFLVLSITAIVCLKHTVTNRFRKTPDVSANQDEIAFVWVLSLFILLSAAAAAAVWIIRNTVIAGSPDEIYPMIIGTTRYTAYACLAYVLIICLIIRLGQTAPGVKPVAAIVTLTLTALALVPAFTLKSNYPYDDALNLSTAGMATGLSPMLPEVEQIWPGAKGDWYWVTALPKTVAWMRGERLGPWHELPGLGATAAPGGDLRSINNLQFTPLLSDVDHTRCTMTGSVNVTRFSFFAKSQIAPIVDENRTVVGFAVMKRQGGAEHFRELQGFVLCKALKNTTMSMRLALGKNQWTESVSASTAGVHPLDVTDPTWNKGFARNWAGFFVADVPANREIFVEGRILKFSIGNLRTVIRVQAANGYLNVFLDGKTLDGELVGAPHLIKLLN